MISFLLLALPFAELAGVDAGQPADRGAEIGLGFTAAGFTCGSAAL